MYKRITLFTFICLLALAGIAQNKDTYTILLSGASFAEPNNKWFEMGCRALHAILSLLQKHRACRRVRM